MNIEDYSYFLKVTDKGGLELYVNAEKVGHAIKPELRPVNDTGNGNDPNATAVGAWIEKPTLNPVSIFDPTSTYFDKVAKRIKLVHVRLTWIR